ncbi:hypothetical protein T484DRAFT_1850572 [Baffinella frigidus]|nr:hypothetical protein T484DRAFT_1850572 [Cryptophyta sp. CCMP2293]
MNAQRPQYDDEHVRLQPFSALRGSLYALRAGTQGSRRPAIRDDLRPPTHLRAAAGGSGLERTNSRTVLSLHRIDRAASTPTGGLRRTASSAALTRNVSLRSLPVDTKRLSQLLSGSRTGAPKAIHADIYRARSQAPSQRRITRSDPRTLLHPPAPDNAPAVQNAEPTSFFEALKLQRARYETSLAAHRARLTRSNAHAGHAPPTPDIAPAVQHAERPTSFFKALKLERATLAAHRTHLTRSDALPARPPSSAMQPSLLFHAALDVERARRDETLTAQRARLTRRNAAPVSIARPSIYIKRNPSAASAPPTPRRR